MRPRRSEPTAPPELSPGARRERAVLVGMSPVGDGDASLEELARLLETAGGEEVGRMRVPPRRPDPATFIGRGKVGAVGELAARVEADLLVFDEELSPSQAAQIEASVGVRVVDRPALILDLFARRARTREARTQVELARLTYLLPRLQRRWSHLGRQVGGIGVRGEGETQLEIDRRLVRRRIGRLREALRRIDRARGERRKRRRRTLQIALVGYTNAGKTTLFNALTGAHGLVEDRLFATLDPLVRPMGRSGRRPMLLIDTVGFVRKLPHSLIASFRSTLGEAAEADLLLHVIDVSHGVYEEQEKTGRDVLSELGLTGTPLLEVFTKSDRVGNEGVLERARRLHAGACFVSAATGDGMDTLRDRIRRELEGRFVEETLILPIEDSAALARLRREAEVLETSFGDSVVEVRCRVEPARLGHLRRIAGKTP